MSSLGDRNSEINQSVMMAEGPLIDEFSKPHSKIIDVPPDANLRTFNVHDILGDLDHDDKGKPIVLPPSADDGIRRDHNGKVTNKKGYLVKNDPKGVIENLNGELMFPWVDIDERDEIPAPFSLEKFNFNPHQLIGHFDFIGGNI